MSKSAAVSTEIVAEAVSAQEFIEIADQFTAAGFDVRSPSWETTSYLRLTNIRGAVPTIHR